MRKFLAIIKKYYNNLLRKVVSTTINSENRIFRFYREPSGRWYVDLPEWKGGKWHLEMVDGANTLLDELCDDENHEVYVQVSTKTGFKSDNIVLEKVADCTYDGADYVVAKSINGLYVKELWLCGVTAWVYGTMPDYIYLRKVFV